MKWLAQQHQPLSVTMPGSKVGNRSSGRKSINHSQAQIPSHLFRYGRPMTETELQHLATQPASAPFRINLFSDRGMLDSILTIA